MHKASRHAEELNGRHVVIFDGVCHFCNSTVNFIIRRDEKGLFCFTPMQSDLAKELAGPYYLDKDGVDTLILIKNEKIYVRTNAALEIAKALSGYWFLLTVLRVIPRSVRDFLYTRFARNRYALFGKRTHCIVPTQAVANRFVGISQ